MKLNLLLLLFFLLSCNQILKFTEDDYDEVINTDGQDHVDIMFSHNINGETHPCGCRKFPLGGIPQAYALLETEKKKTPHIYVDSGDAFFESTIVPEFLLKSSKFKASKIAEAFNLLGLQIFLPGDQDFSMGENFLLEVSKTAQFEFLISNSSNKLKIPHKKLILKKAGPLNIFFIGIARPDLYQIEQQHFFTSPQEAIKSQLEVIDKNYKQLSNKRIILLSHSGMNYDEKLAEKFPQIDWIIGAHTQSFLRKVNPVGNTKIVQVLSKNHYIGQISLSLGDKKLDKYKLNDMHEEVENLLKPNKMITWLSDYKTKYDQVLAEEQKISLNPDSTEQRIMTFNSCLECHKKQVDFWQGTAHSLAYTTLIEAKADKNPQCIKCHSVGHRQEGGFITFGNIIQGENKKVIDYKKYWAEFQKNIQVKHPVRDASNQDRKTWSKLAMAQDKALGVTHNFAHVQCLNCHNLSSDHPFGDDSPFDPNIMQSKCLSCHDKDQSPSWYDKDSKGLATSLNQQYFASKLKEVSCPKGEE